MSHLLAPADETAFLDPEEVVARLQQAIPHCQVDREAGAQVVEETIAALIRMNAPPDMIQKERDAQSQAIGILITDQPDSENSLFLTIKPEEGILVGYHSLQHQEACEPLVRRCAEVLGYEVGWP